MRALPSITLLLAITGLAIVAQAQTPPPGLPLKLPQPARLAPRPIAEASFRPLAMMNDMLRLNGEQSMDERAIFLTQAEAIRATAFRLSYLNAVSNLPEASRLTVRVNDQTVGEVRLNCRKTVKTGS